MKSAKILKSKLLTIYIYILWSCVLWVVKMFFSGDVNNPFTFKELLLIPINPLLVYWYIYNLIFYYLFFYWFDIVKLSEKYKFAVIFIISILSSLFNIDLVFPIIKIIKYSVFFYVGIVLSKGQVNTLILESKATIAVITIFAAIGIIISGAASINLLSVAGVGVIISTIISLGIVIIFIKSDCNNKFLKFIGEHSLEIYVTHSFIIVANRKLLPLMGITNFYVNVTINFFMALFIPVICALLLKKMNLHKLIFKPASYFSEKTYGGN